MKSTLKALRRTLLLGAIISMFALPQTGFAIYNATITDRNIENHANANNKYTIAYHLKKMGQNGGGTLTLKNGVYKVKNSLVVPPNVTIKGTDKNKTIIQFKKGLSPAKGTHIIESKTRNAYNIQLRNFTVRAKQKYSTQSCIALDGRGQNTHSKIVIRNVNAYDCGQHGIYAEDIGNMSIKYVTLKNNGTKTKRHHNMYLRRIKNSTVENVDSSFAKGNGFNSAQNNNLTVNYYRAYRNGQHGIRFARSRNGKILNSTADNNTNYGIVFFNENENADESAIKDPADRYNYNATIRNSQANGNAHGIMMRHTTGYKITGTKAKHNRGYGLITEKSSKEYRTGNDFQSNSKGKILRK